MELDPRWEEVCKSYSAATSHLFKVWTLAAADARAFQRQWNARLDDAQPRRYVADVSEGDYYGVALYMCDLMRDRATGESVALLLLREAVELLHALAHVVPLPLWREIFVESFYLKDEWRHHVVPVWAFMPYDVMARNVDVANKDVMEFVAGMQFTPRSSLYAEAKKLMSEILGLDTDLKLQRHLPTTLEMRLMLTPPIATFVPPDKLTAHLRAMQQALHAATRQPAHEQAMPMKVVSTILTATLEQDDVDAHCLAELAEMCAAAPMGYLNVHLKPAESDKGAYPWAPIKKLLDHLALDRATPDRERHLGVGLAAGDLRRFIAVCSAVRESQCVGAFAVYANPTSWPRETWLRWLAWSWLSTDNNHTSLTATLNTGDITEEDVAVVQDVFAGGNPLSTTAPPLRWVVTTAEATASFDDATTHGAKVSIPQGTRVAVVDEVDASTLRVVVPGLGIATVDRASTQPIAAPPLRSRVAKLDMYGMEGPASVRGTVALVQLLGGSLTSVGIAIRDEKLREDHVAGILRSCPRLEQLKLSGSVLDSLDFIVDYCNSPASTLTELILNDVRLDTPRGADAFFAALETPSSRLARTLRVMAVGFTDDAQVDASAVDHAYTMLDRNRRLKSVQVRFPARLRPSEMRYPASDGVSIAQPAYMVPLAHKHALLGALRKGEASAQALALDRLALANVLVFAAEQSVRWALVNYGQGY